MKDQSARAEALLADCETGEEVIELLAGMLDTLAYAKTRLEREIAYMEELDDEGDRPEALYVADFAQELVYSLEENT